MKSSKLFLLLSTLQEAEWMRLESFLLSPYFNTDSEVTQLFRLLATHHQKHPIPAPPAKEELAQQLWPGQAYDAKNFTYLLSRLSKLIEHFLAIEKLDAHGMELAFAKLEIFSERNLDKHYRSTKREIERQLENGGERFLGIYKSRARLAEIDDQNYIRQKRRVHDISIQQAAFYLDYSYYLQRLHQACSMLDRQLILQVDYNITISDSWIAQVQEHLAGQEAIIQIYLSIFKMLRNEKETKHFSTFKKRLANLPRDASAQDLAEIYQFGINYCARKIRAGEAVYVEEALQLYIEAIENGWLIIDGQLSPWTYANVVKLYLRKEEFTEAEVFIHRYLPALPASFKENAYHYNLAELYYYTGAYAKAQEHLVEVAYTDLNYYLGARVLLAKIYYQTGAFDALSSLLAAFMMFLQRNKELSKNLKTTYLNFCKILARILRSAEDKFPQIRETITTTPLLTDRAWLLEAIQT